MAVVIAAAVIGSLLAPVSVAVAAGPDYSRKWAPPNTALPRTPSVKGSNTAGVPAVKPTYPVPPTWQPPKDIKPTATPTGHASVKLGSAPAAAAKAPVAGEATEAGSEVGAAGLPVSLAPLAGSSAAGQSVQVDMADAKAAGAAGLPGPVVLLSRDGTADTASVRVSIDTAKLGTGYGADWAARARLVTLPACSLTTPQVPGCLEQTPVASHFDVASKKLVADVALPASGRPAKTQIQSLSAAGATSSATVLAAVSGSSSGGGTYAATSLNPSQAWTAGSSSGAFSYSYPIQAPPALAGSAPQVSLSYDSASVDGKTSSTNSQASWIGDGWDYSTGFIERSYQPCSRDGIANSGDQCWAGANLSLSLAGHSGELVQDDSSCQASPPGATEQSNCTWRLKDDDATKVQFLTGATNGTWNGSYIKVTDTGGTVFYFGLNHLPDASGNPTTKGPDSGSALTVPVYSPNAGDPCYDGAKGKASWCQTAWRWNLDYVVDPHGNLTTYAYTPEANFYSRGGGQNNGTGSSSSYTRASVLQSIGYGQLLSDQLNANGAYNPAAKIDFAVSERCVTSPAACDPAQRTSANAGNWPDVPLDQQCNAGAACTNYGPSFWTTKWLTSVTTKVRVNGAYQNVDSYALNHTFINVQNSSENTQVPWLSSVQRTGSDTQASPNAVPLPAVSFTAMLLRNRVDGTNLVPSRPEYNRPRIQLITTETGGTIGVDYKPADCSRVNGVMPASADTDTRSCFNVKWHQPNEQAGAQPVDDWFLRYPVSTVTSNPNTPGAVPMTTAYSYGSAAWHRDDSSLTQDMDRTWAQFRGYASVTSVVGSGQDGSPKSQKSTTFHQGMNGDITSTGTRNATVAGPMSGAVTDSDWLAGQTLESDTYTQAGGTITAYVVNTSSTPVTTATHNRGTYPALIARYAATSSTATSKSLKTDGTWRAASKTTTTDPAHGNRVSTSLDRADGLPDLCTRTGYAAGSDPQVLGIASEQVVVNGANACTATPTATNTSAWSRTYFDGQVFGQLGTAHNPTSVLVLDRFDTGGTPQFSTMTAGFDTYGRPTSATDPTTTDSAHPSGATITTSYTAVQAGELPSSTTVTTPAPAGAADVLTGRTTVTTFDTARSLPISVTDANNRVTTTAYDAAGRLTGVWLPGRAKPQSANQTFAYALPGTVNGTVVPPSVTSSSLRANGSYAVSIQIMDGTGRAIQTQASPALSAYTGRMISDVGYDSHGRAMRSNASWYNNDAPPSSTLYQTTTQQVPAQSHTVYDGLGRTTTTEFLAYGVVQSSSTVAYPGADRTDSNPPAGSTASSTVVDARGRTTQLWQYKTPTATGNPADADVTTYTYTADGQVATQKDAAGNTWTHGYDLRGREITSTDPDTGTSIRTYDTAGRLTSSTDARNQSIAFTYDLLGRPTGTYTGSVAAANQLTGFTYDTVLKGQPATTTRYVGGMGGSAYTSAVLTYDTAYRPTTSTVTIPGSEIGSSTPFTYTYQATYNAITGALTSDYRSAVGDIAAESIDYKYDKYGPLSSFGTAATTYDTSSNWDAYGRNIRSTMNPWGTQIVVTNTYDESTGRPLSQYVDKQTAATGAVQQNTYAYNASGQITAIRSIPDNTPGVTDLQCFGYDYLGRLTTAWSDTGTLTLAPQPTVGNQGSCTNTTPTSGAQIPARTTVGGPAPYWQSYTYDLTGNRKQLVEHDPSGDPTKDTTVNQTFPPAGTVNTALPNPQTGGTGGPHALTASTTTTPTATLGSTSQYDTAGNTTAVTDTSGTATLTWNPEGKLATYTKTGSAGPTTYLYDATGNQLIRRDPGKTTITLGGDELVYDTAAQTVTGTRYYQIPGGITLVRQGGKATYQINDHHGTGTLALDATTLTESRRTNDPFGNPRGTQPTTWAGDHGYVGGTKDDATGLTNLGAREYQPTTGRFLNPDPLLDPASPQQWNGYAYSNNNPVNLSDPSGLIAYDPETGVTAGNTQQLQQTVNKVRSNPEYEDPLEADSSIETRTMISFLATAEKAQHQDVDRVASDKEFTRVIRKYNLGSSTIDWAALQMWEFGATEEEADFFRANYCLFIDCGLIGQMLGTNAVGDPLSTPFGNSPMEKTANSVAGSMAGVAARGGRPGELMGLSEGALSRLCDSFVANTPVVMTNGDSKPIDQVQVGDNVLATDPQTGVSAAKTVTAVITTPDDEDFTDLSFGDSQDPTATGPAPGATLTTTWHHPFWSLTAERWTEASSLQIGEELRQPDGGAVAIRGVHNYHRQVLTYNLTVTDFHAYYVLAGETPVLVHNSSNCGMRTHDKARGAAGVDEMTETFEKFYNKSDIYSESYGNGLEFWTPYGVRQVDIAVRNPDGNLHLYEVKVNKSNYTKGQRRKDEWLAKTYGFETSVVRRGTECPICNP
ncbi:type IV secretion protein Rhs [Kitasatospora indigofera]|uniref:Type IV secretion protein Rhs n=1 Tax=Kitasatospora indigofera TaxID=67307 RepID=A0A919KQ24_9ACTN|nr:RHS repeat-associated core domain-containing protein [Kitasatospora indigofera]GHH67792.1 type IV secretion protein Rhs [Kitasatospora indigofera]